jgi:hypothetical protein
MVLDDPSFLSISKDRFAREEREDWLDVGYAIGLGLVDEILSADFDWHSLEEGWRRRQGEGRMWDSKNDELDRYVESDVV